MTFLLTTLPLFHSNHNAYGNTASLTLFYNSNKTVYIKRRPLARTESIGQNLSVRICLRESQCVSFLFSSRALSFLFPSKNSRSWNRRPRDASFFVPSLTSSCPSFFPRSGRQPTLAAAIIATLSPFPPRPLPPPRPYDSLRPSCLRSAPLKSRLLCRWHGARRFDVTVSLNSPTIPTVSLSYDTPSDTVFVGAGSSVC